jgi:hypothetical protein
VIEREPAAKAASSLISVAGSILDCDRGILTRLLQPETLSCILGNGLDVQP